MFKNINALFLIFIFAFQNIQSKDDSFIDKRKYPNRKSIKGLQPDFQTIGQIIGNAVHTVAINFVWIQWQPTLKKGTCSSNEFEYNGLCYILDKNVIEVVKTYTNSEVMVTAVLYGVPSWARRSCSTSVDPMFCAPTEEGAVYYGLFVKFIAYFFNGENGNGRVADFVIHNEVNAIEWFNFGCDNGNCDIDIWTTIYSQSYNQAYDNILKEQKNAKVLISFEHDFFKELDPKVKSKDAVISCETFLEKLIPKLGNRKWRLAYHSYPIDLLNPEFGPNDYPYITFGNIGVLSGWLHKHYPNNPHAWEIQLTENGINGKDSSMFPAQRSYLCKAFKNILGTPGVESFIYHRLVDHPVELKDGLGCGLWTPEKNFKPAWELFALANRNGVGEGYPTCGFELLPYVEMVNAYNGNFHYVSTRNVPSDFKKQSSFLIKRDNEPNVEMSLVYECRVGGPKGGHTFISSDFNCENTFNMGPMGYLYVHEVANSIPIYRCLITKNADHFISKDPNCDGLGKAEALMGYGFSA
jgi:hypothetical protein